jgi:hypothetical protein
MPPIMPQSDTKRNAEGNNRHWPGTVPDLTELLRTDVPIRLSRHCAQAPRRSPPSRAAPCRIVHRDRANAGRAKRIQTRLLTGGLHRHGALALRGGEMAHLRRSRSIGALSVNADDRRKCRCDSRGGSRGARASPWRIRQQEPSQLETVAALARGESCLFCAVMVRSCPARILNAFATAPS